jgi:hypothetical protein
MKTACKHPRISMSLATIVARNDSDDGVIIDVFCASCGLSGSFSVEPYEVNWDEDESDERREVRGTRA